MTETTEKRKSSYDRGREKSKEICDLLLLTGSSNTHFLQPEDLEVPTGGKKTENTSEKINSTIP